MNRFLKISKLLKIAQGEDVEAWKAVLAEAENDQLPPEYTGIIESAKDSAEKASELKAEAKAAKDKVGKVPPEVKEDLTRLIENPEALRAFVEAARMGATASILENPNIAISKRAGILGGIWSAFKGGFKTLFHYFPLIGVFWSLYEAKKDFEEVQKSSLVIRDSFSELGTKEKLFDGKYISELIDQHKDDADKILLLTKLNEVAKFYNENVYMVWADLAWFVSDLIASIFIIGSMVATGGISGVVATILTGIGTALGLGSVAVSLSVEFFDAMLGAFDENKETIIKLAKDHIGTDNSSEHGGSALETSEPSEEYLE